MVYIDDGSEAMTETRFLGAGLFGAIRRSQADAKQNIVSRYFPYTVLIFTKFKSIVIYMTYKH